VNSHIQVAHGRVIDPLNPDPDKIKIVDIAHSLAHQCRYAGHVKEFYSVAQHSIIASMIVSVENAFSALMHDASEAYLVDVPSPLKNALFGDRYREVENLLMTTIAKKYGFAWPMPKEVEYADNALLRTEVRDLMWPVSDCSFDLWSPWFFADPLPDTIAPWAPVFTEKAFIKRFIELGGNVDD